MSPRGHKWSGAARLPRPSPQQQAVMDEHDKRARRAEKELAQCAFAHGGYPGHVFSWAEIRYSLRSDGRGAGDLTLANLETLAAAPVGSVFESREDSNFETHTITKVSP